MACLTKPISRNLNSLIHEMANSLQILDWQGDLEWKLSFLRVVEH
jgi:hypothetical protein